METQKYKENQSVNIEKSIHLLRIIWVKLLTGIVSMRTDINIKHEITASYVAAKLFGKMLGILKINIII